MLNGKQSGISRELGRIVRFAVVLTVLLMISGAVTVQAQKGAGPSIVSPKDHTAYYLPYFDGDRYFYDYFYWNFSHYRCGRRYNPGYWYPWTFAWGRYDIPSDRWWTFAEGVYNHYPGGIWTADAPLLATARKTAVGPAPPQLRPVTRAIKPPPQVARRSGSGSTGILSGRRSSLSSSGRSSGVSSSRGSSGGGASIGSSSGGGGSKSGTK